MDVKKLIQAAEYCAIEAHETCKDCPMYDDCPADDRDPVDIAMRLLAIRDHVKAEVIAQVREWIYKGDNGVRHKSYEFTPDYIELFLNSLEESHG